MRKHTAVLSLLLALLLTLSIRDNLEAQNGGAGQKKDFVRTVARYSIPEVTLENQDNKKVRLRAFFQTNKPVIVNFIYTTCTTICPVEAANFSNFQKRLGSESAKVQLLSISIDPEHDTPKVMKEYLKRFYATDGWTFLSGEKEAIQQVITTFNTGGTFNKMNHYPLILIKVPRSEQWIRLYGLVGTATLLDEYSKIDPSR